jgi:hypothetical protein
MVHLLAINYYIDKKETVGTVMAKYYILPGTRHNTARSTVLASQGIAVHKRSRAPYGPLSSSLRRLMLAGEFYASYHPPNVLRVTRTASLGTASDGLEITDPVPPIPTDDRRSIVRDGI